MKQYRRRLQRYVDAGHDDLHGWRYGSGHQPQEVLQLIPEDLTVNYSKPLVRKAQGLLYIAVERRTRCAAKHTG